MASIYTTVDIDVDIKIDEIVDSCSSRDIENLLKYLSQSGHLKPSISTYIDETKMTAGEADFHDKMNILAAKYHQMSVEEIDTIENIYNKYR
jgi:hypothetical protein